MADQSFILTNWPEQVPVDDNNPLPVSQPTSGKSAFGDTVVASNRPYVQAKGVYGFIPNSMKAITTLSGTAGGRSIDNFAISGGTSIPIDLSPYDNRITPGARLTIAAQVTSGAAANVTAALTYYEDI